MGGTYIGDAKCCSCNTHKTTQYTHDDGHEREPPCPPRNMRFYPMMRMPTRYHKLVPSIITARSGLCSPLSQLFCCHYRYSSTFTSFAFQRQSNDWTVLHTVSTAPPRRHSQLTCSKADLEYNVETTFHHTSPYSDIDRAIQNAAWASYDVKPDRFAVALEDSYTEDLGVPHAMRWPWDRKKGVYVIQSGHEVHCLVCVFTFVREKHD